MHPALEGGRLEEATRASWHQVGAKQGLRPTSFRGKKSGRESFSGPARHRRFLTEASDCNLAFRGEALHSPPDSSAVEPGVGQMGNAGFREGW